MHVERNLKITSELISQNFAYLCSIKKRYILVFTSVVTECFM
jgi:hypothetical protein